MNEFIITNDKNGVMYGQFKHLCNLPVKHGISTRLGGKSQPPYESLNLGLHTGDDANIVNFNRQKFCNAVGVLYEDSVTAEQTHGDNIAVVSYSDAGRGHNCYGNSIKNTDALITNSPNLPLMLFFADCVPVLIADPVCKAIGLSHAGWKGTVAKIAQKTVLKMQAEFGTNPADCRVGIGPSIGSCCYEVDEPVVTKLIQNFSNWQQLVKPLNKARWQLDLWETNKVQLLEVGVKNSNIIISGMCTSCNTDLFFSHRAEQGQTGRLGAIIALA